MSGKTTSNETNMKENQHGSRRRWSFFQNSRSTAADPASRIRQLHQDLISLVIEESNDDDAPARRRLLQRRNKPGYSLWRRLGDSALSTTDEGIPEPPRSPRRRRLQTAAASFRGIVETASSEDGAVDEDKAKEAGSTIEPSRTATVTAKVSSCSLPKETWEDLEAALVETVRDIGVLLVESQPKRSAPSSLRGDPAFEYFCEAALLPVLVDIASDKPVAAAEPNDPLNVSSRDTRFHQVVWSPAVKAQVLETASLLVSSLRDKSALYFVLSQNSVNHLVSFALPLQQWTEQASRRLIPAYVDFLKALTLQLTACPHLFPCFLDGGSDPTSAAREGGNGGDDTSLPLLTGLLETAAFGYSQSDSFVHATCLNLLVNLLHVPPVHQWVSHQQQQGLQQPPLQQAQSLPSAQIGSEEKKEDSTLDGTRRNPPPPPLPISPPPQVCLASHLTLLFLDRFERLVTLTEGPVVCTVRSTALAGQLSVWNHQIDLLNDVFDCGVSSWNVRICETFLRGFVSRLLLSLDGGACCCGGGGASTRADGKTAAASPPRGMLLGRGADVGVMDADVLPQPEARAQVATLALMLLFDRLEYPPLVRMLAVAMFHPKTTEVWDDDETSPHGSVAASSILPYTVTPALNDIVQGGCDQDSDLLLNPFRREFLNALQGDYGEYRFIPTAMLAEAAINALDRETLDRMSILEPIEHALSAFLVRQHLLKSTVSKVAVQSAAALAVQIICTLTKSGRDSGSLQLICTKTLHSPVLLSLRESRDYFYKKTIDMHQIMGVSEIFVDLIESAVLGFYKSTTVPVVEANGPLVAAFTLSRHSCGSFAYHESLIRKMRGANRNDVEATRFYAEMAIFYRACCRLVKRFVSQLESTARSTKEAAPHLVFDPMDTVDELATIFSSLSDKPSTGTVLDLRGRMTFPFTVITSRRVEDQASGPSSQSHPLSEAISHQKVSRLILVLDPMDMFVLKPVPRSNGWRATVMCCIPLLDVIAAAADHVWLHVAVKHPDIGFLIKNGNMALRFESAGTCLIVRQYLERSRRALRAEMLEKIKLLLRAQRLGDAKDEEPSKDQSINQAQSLKPEHGAEHEQGMAC
jgi:protein CLEC16A